jgi:hypothetical protein
VRKWRQQLQQRTKCEHTAHRVTSPQLHALKFIHSKRYNFQHFFIPLPQQVGARTLRVAEMDARARCGWGADSGGVEAFCVNQKLSQYRHSSFAAWRMCIYIHYMQPRALLCVKTDFVIHAQDICQRRGCRRKSDGRILNIISRAAYQMPS